MALGFGNRIKLSAQRKEVKGSEEDAEFGPGSSGVIGLFRWLWGLRVKQIEMPEVRSGFHG